MKSLAYFFCLFVFSATTASAKPFNEKLSDTGRVSYPNGVTSIFDPGIWSEKGKTHYISEDSDMSVVCRLLGFKQYVSHSTFIAHPFMEKMSMVVISSNLDSIVVSPKAGSSRVIKTINCI